MDALRAGRSYDPMGMLTPNSQASGTDDAEGGDEVPDDFYEVSSADGGDPLTVLQQCRQQAADADRLARDARDTAIQNGFGRHIMPFRPGEPGYTGEPSTGFRY